MRSHAPLVVLLLAALLGASPLASSASEGVATTPSEWPPDLILAGVLIGIGALASLAVAGAALHAARRAPDRDPAVAADEDRRARRARARRHLDDDPIMAAMGLGDDAGRRPRRARPGED